MTIEFSRVYSHHRQMPAIRKDFPTALPAGTTVVRFVRIASHTSICFDQSVRPKISRLKPAGSSRNERIRSSSRRRLNSSSAAAFALNDRFKLLVRHVFDVEVAILVDDGLLVAPPLRESPLEPPRGALPSHRPREDRFDRRFFRDGARACASGKEISVLLCVFRLGLVESTPVVKRLFGGPGRGASGAEPVAPR